MNPIQHSTTADCNCTTCATLRDAARSAGSILIEHMRALKSGQVLEKVVTAAGLLGEAHSLLSHNHSSASHDAVIQRALPPSASSQLNSSSPRKLIDFSFQTAKSPNFFLTKASGAEAVQSRLIKNPWEGRVLGKLPPGFEEDVRARAAALGITNTQPDTTEPEPSTTLTIIQEKKSLAKERTQFIVCDHCRSHGLRCNESSVCKECILRRVPCTHRPCELSPSSREDCPRQVCFYVHGDWMPDVHGQHKPSDVNWLILPGKLRDHLSAGQLGKLPAKSEEEVIACYRTVHERQMEAIRQMAICVQQGLATWETVTMKCACVDIEQEEARTKFADQGLRRLGVSGPHSSIL